MEQYADKLEKIMRLNMGMAALMLVAMLVLVVFCLKFKDTRMAIVSIVGGIAIVLAMYCFCLYPYQKDINEQAFITYHGEFVVEDYYYVGRGGAYILLQCPEEQKSVRYQVLCDVPEVENGRVYQGEFVYSKRSKCLLNIEIVHEYNQRNHPDRP